MALSIRLDPETEARLDALAKETGRTKSFYVRTLIEEYLEDLEDLYLGMEISQQVKSGKMPTYSAEEVGQRLGLVD